MPPVLDKSEQKIVIIGAGCFGLSTAYHLLKRGYSDVTVLDRAKTLPANDAASSDLNKIVRSAYDDQFYVRLAHKAIEEWKTNLDWEGCYHGTGVFVYGGDSSKVHASLDCDRGASLSTDRPITPILRTSSASAAGAYGSPFNPSRRSQRFPSTPTASSSPFTSPPITPSSSRNSGESEVAESDTTNDMDFESDVQAFFPQVEIGPALQNAANGYMSRDGGWVCADAECGATKKALDIVEQRGARIRSGCRVVSLLKSKEGVTCGVRCSNGEDFEATTVVVASGAWTASTFSEFDLKEKCHASGQCVAGIELGVSDGDDKRDKEQLQAEIDQYSECPVVLDLAGTGFYIFPPNRDNVMKFALHSPGYRRLDPATNCSRPTRVFANGLDGKPIPPEDALLLRQHLRNVYPSLAHKPFKFTRICWYTETPDSDWLIDTHPSDPGVLFATSGSGHAYKFFPVLGELVVNRLEGIPLVDDVFPDGDRFSFSRKRKRNKQEGYRNADPKDLPSCCL